MELLDVVDEYDNLTGEVKEREVVHNLGLWHREVVIWIINEKNEILIQKRAATKKQAPNKWALTAGHVDAGEEPLQVAIRETEEELGLKVPENEMKFLFTCKRERKFSDTQYNNHFKYIYYIKTNKKISDFTIQKEELSEVKYITLKELEEIDADNDKNYALENSEFVSKSVKLLKEKLEIN